MSIRKNTTYNLLGAVLPIVLSLFTIPLYISLIGEARYGVLSVAWLLLGYFGLFDLGLGRATAQRIAALGNSSSEELALTFWTAIAINITLGVIGGVIIWPVANYFFRTFLNVDGVLLPELAAAIPWLILAVPLTTLSGVLTGALEGRAQFKELNFISVSSSILIQLLPLTIAWVYGPELTWLLPAVILSRLGTLTLLFFRCSVHVFRGRVPVISRAQAKILLQFGGWVTVTSLVGPLMVILDRFLIGATLGAKAVTYYTVPFQLAERFTILPGALTTALFPRLALAGKEETNHLATIAIRSLAVVMTPLVLMGVLLIEPFLGWWLNSEFALKAGLTAKILLVAYWINSFARVPYAVLQAAGRPDVVAKCHLGELIPYLLLLCVALHYWGLPGAAVVFGLRTLSDCLLLMWCANSLRAGFSLLTMPFLLLIAGFSAAIGLSINGTLWWLALITLLLLSLVWSWSNAPPEVRNLTIPIFKRFKTSEKGR